MDRLHHQYVEQRYTTTMAPDPMVQHFILSNYHGNDPDMDNSLQRCHSYCNTCKQDTCDKEVCHTHCQAHVGVSRTSR